MLVYASTKADFHADVVENRIEQRVHDAFRSRIGHSTSRSEISSWTNSIQYMNNVLQMSDIPGDSGVAIEYRIPQTSKRIDFIVTGSDSKRRDTAIIIELKQWSEVEPTTRDGIVATYFRGACAKRHIPRIKHGLTRHCYKTLTKLSMTATLPFSPVRTHITARRIQY